MFPITAAQIPKSEIARSRDNSLSYQTVFLQKLHYFTFLPAKYMVGTLHMLTNTYNFLISVLLCSQGCNHPMDMKWYVTVALICLSLMTSGAE